MSKVDWSLAPEGTTHWDDSSHRINSFMKLSGEDWFYWPPESDSPSWNYWGSNSKHDTREMIERPKQPKAWSGPEDGLPPVGMTVQVWDREPHKFYANHVGKSVEILAHRIGSYDEPVAVYCFKEDDGTDGYHALVNTCFRPVQPIEDARESAIRELMDIAQVDCRVTAARLVDAGFKREVV